jgi:hypothetical protein
MLTLHFNTCPTLAEHGALIFKNHSFAHIVLSPLFRKIGVKAWYKASPPWRVHLQHHSPSFDSQHNGSHDLIQMLDLPPELKYQILQYLITEEQLDMYFALLQIPELVVLVRCNFTHQLNLIAQLRPLATQLHHISASDRVAMLPAVVPRSSRRMARFLERHLLGASRAVEIHSPEKAVSALIAYRTQLRNADTILAQFAKMIRGNSMAWKFRYQEQPYCGFETLSKVEHHRVLRVILRLQLYEKIRALYGASRKRKRRVRALFSQ